MSAPIRPDPDPMRPRFRHRVERLLDRVVLRDRSDLRDRADRSAAPAALPPADDPTISANVSPQLVLVLVLIGAVLLMFGLVLGWQSWSNRSAPPIDDQMPFLDATKVESTPDADPPVDRPQTDTQRSASEMQVGAGSLDVVVHIAGAVVAPGVVSLPAGSRVYQAIELAGGPSADADLDRVNLAAPVIDGERIHLPEIGEEIIPAEMPPPSSETGLSAVPDSIDVNNADVAELELLRGIGPSLAQAIVTTRIERGPFRSVDELLSVPGIGEAKLEQIRDQIIVR